jgi:hypothetical protein
MASAHQNHRHLSGGSSSKKAALGSKGSGGGGSQRQAVDDLLRRHEEEIRAEVKSGTKSGTRSGGGISRTKASAKEGAVVDQIPPSLSSSSSSRLVRRSSRTISGIEKKI